jgi:hypothetical protein
MNLFPRRGTPEGPTQPTDAPASVPANSTLPPNEPDRAAIPLIVPTKSQPISLSDEQKHMLDVPVDPRVHRLLRDLNAEKSAAAEKLKNVVGGAAGGSAVLPDRL